jgi:hypothetical protein
MPLRLLEVVLPEDSTSRKVEELLREEPLAEVWYDRISEQQTLIKILASAEETEHLMDLLDSIRPRAVVSSHPLAGGGLPPPGGRAPGEEAEDEADQKRRGTHQPGGDVRAVKDMARLTRVYLGMTACPPWWRPWV